MSSDSLRRWIPGLRRRQPAAAEAVVRHARPGLLRLARRLLRGARSAEEDEEDVVNAALHSFLRRAGEDQFPELEDEQDVWRLLQTIVARKAANQRRRSRRRRDCLELSSADLVAERTDPAELADQRDWLQWLLQQLSDAELTQIALLKLEDWTHVQIAAELGRSLATVERRLRLIRSQWRRAVAQRREAGAFVPEWLETLSPADPAS